MASENGCVAHAAAAQFFMNRAEELERSKTTLNTQAQTLGAYDGMLKPFMEGIALNLRGNAQQDEELLTTLQVLAFQAGDDGQQYRENQGMERQNINSMRGIVTNWLNVERTRYKSALQGLELLSENIEYLDTDSMLTGQPQPAHTPTPREDAHTPQPTVQSHTPQPTVQQQATPQAVSPAGHSPSGVRNADPFDGGAAVQSFDDPQAADPFEQTSTSDVNKSRSVRGKKAKDKLEKMSSKGSSKSHNMLGTLKRKTKSLTLRKKKKDEQANSHSDLSNDGSTTNMQDDTHSTNTTPTATTTSIQTEPSTTDHQPTPQSETNSFATTDDQSVTHTGTEPTTTQEQGSANYTTSQPQYSTPQPLPTNSTPGEFTSNMSVPAPPGVVPASNEQLGNPFEGFAAPAMPVDANNVSGSAFNPQPPVDSQVAQENAPENTTGTKVAGAVAQDSDDSFSDSSDDESGKPAIMVKIRPKDEREEINEEVDLSTFKLDSINSPPSSRSRRERSTPQPQQQQDDTPFDLGESRWKSEQAVNQLHSQDSAAPTDSSGAVSAMARSTTTPALYTAPVEADPNAQLAKAVAMQAALTETSNVYFKGSKVGKSLLAGKLMLSFNQCLERVLEDPERSQPLKINFSSKVPISQIVMNPAFREASRGTSKLAAGETLTLEVSATDLLTALTKKNPPAQGIQMVGKSYRLTLLTYQSVSQNGTDLVPLLVDTQWQCAANATDVTCRYNLNSDSVGAPELALNDLKVVVQMAGDTATSGDSESADCHWDASTQKLEWTIPKLDKTTAGGTLKAHFAVEGKSKKTKTMIRFHANGSIMSGAVLDNAPDAPAYFKLRKVIRKTTAGKYISDFTTDSTGTTGSAPSLPASRVNSQRKLPLPKELQEDIPTQTQEPAATPQDTTHTPPQQTHTADTSSEIAPEQAPVAAFADSGIIGMDPSATVAAITPTPGPFEFISAGLTNAYEAITGETSETPTHTHPHPPQSDTPQGESLSNTTSQLIEESKLPRKTSLPPSHPPPQRSSQDVVAVVPPELPPPRKSSRGDLNNPFGDN